MLAIETVRHVFRDPVEVLVRLVVKCADHFSIVISALKRNLPSLYLRCLHFLPPAVFGSHQVDFDDGSVLFFCL